VAGLTTANASPEVAFRHSLPMNRSVRTYAPLNAGVRFST